MNKYVTIIIFAMITTILIRQSLAVACNNFPKVIGSSTGDTYLYHLDVYGDYLATGGEIKDFSLTGSSSYLPYAAVSSIANSGQIYWAKALTSKAGINIAALQFSTDGVLLIGHSGLATSNFIIVFNSATGAVISTRGYSTFSYDNYDKRIQSIIVSSGASPMAYVLSKYQSSTLCQSQHLLKFNPLAFVTTPIWAKKTSASFSGDDCANLGLKFGRTESILYVYSWYNSKATLTMMDSNGNYIWAQSFQGGDSVYGNLIQYKAIDSNTDMIITTGGYSFINYNRVIASSISPYLTQTGSKTYRDPNSSIYREIRALYILSLTIAYSLVYDFSNYWSDFATIDFTSGIEKVTYKRSFPYMPTGGMTVGKILSSSIYYVGSYSDYLYKSQSMFSDQYFNSVIKYQSIVYSSDQTQTTCYTMSTDASQTPIYMGTLSMSSVSSFYVASTVTFVADLPAAVTVDFIQSQLTKVSWCLQYPFTVNTVTQTQSTFSFITNLAQQNLAIVPFSATLNCGSYANTWTYSGIDMSDGTALDSVADQARIISNNGYLQIDQTKPPGTYKIKVLGTLPDLYSTFSAIFTVIIGSNGNQAPYFNPSLSDVSVALGSSVLYPYTTFDPDVGDIVTVTAFTQTPVVVPSFISYTQTGLTIHPIVMADVNVYTIQLTITDTHTSPSFTFVLTVTNQAPIVTTTIPADITVTFGVDYTYNLPTSQDPESLFYTTTIQSGPSYATILSSTQLRINPTNCQSDFGNQVVQIKLEDTQPKSYVYSFTIKVPNLAPVFQDTLLDQSFMFNTVLTQPLPSYQDPEGCSLTISIEPASLSSFISISGSSLIISPKTIFQVGDFSIQIVITDPQGLQAKTPFKFTVYEPPKFTNAVVRQLDLMASNQASYSLPVMEGISGEYVTHDSPLPRCTRFNYPDYTFLPDRLSDLGFYTIKGKLWNSYASISFSFKINVTNEAPYLQAQLKDQIVVGLTQVETLGIPTAIDREGQKITYVAYQKKKSKLPEFVSLNMSTSEFVIAPTSIDPVDIYQIQLDLIDPFLAQSSYSFEISLYDPFLFLQTVKTPNITGDKTQQIPVIKGQNQTEQKISYVKINIMKVTREQEATIKLTSDQRGVAEIIKQISNSSMEISVVSKNISLYQVKYEIKSKETAIGVIRIMLKFPNPSNLSNSQIPDQLQVKVSRRIQNVAKLSSIILLENILVQVDIPPQITAGYDQQVATSLQGGRLTFTESTPVNMFIGFLVQFIWSQLEDFSFLTINSMIAVPIPGIPSLIQVVMIKFIYFDILYTEMWMPQFLAAIGMDTEIVEGDNPVNIFFDENGFESKQFLKNAGSTFIFIALYIAAWIIYFIVSRIAGFWLRIIPLKQKLEKILIWRQSLNLLFSQFTPFVLCSMINLYDVRLKTNERVAQVSAAFAFAVLLFTILALVMLIVKVLKLTKNMTEESIQQFKNEYSKLSENLKETKINKLVFLWRPLNLARWLLTMLTLLLLQNHPAVQIMILLILSHIQQSLLLISNPYETKSLNYISLFNEVATSAYLYLTLLVSDFSEQLFSTPSDVQKFRLKTAWLIACLLLSVIFINLLYVFKSILNSMSIQIRECLRKNKRVEEQNQVIQIKPMDLLSKQTKFRATGIEDEFNLAQINTSISAPRVEFYQMKNEITRARKLTMKIGPKNVGTEESKIMHLQKYETAKANKEFNDVFQFNN